MRPQPTLARFARPHDGTRLSAWKLTTFALPGVAMRAGQFPLIYFLPAMYSQEYGLSLAAVGLVFTAIRLTDAAWDPLIAIYLDRTDTRFGRRRPWVIAGTPVILLALVLLYMPRLFVGEQASPIYLFIGLAVLYLGQTFYGLAHTAWGAELSTEYHERTRIQAFESWIGTAGGIAVLAIPIFYELFVDADRFTPRVEAMGWFALVMIPLTVAAAVLTVPERRVHPPVRIDFLKAVKVLFSNPHLVRIAIIDTLVGMSAGVQVALTVFFFKYVIEVPQAATANMVVLYSAALIAMPIWVRVSRRFSKHTAVGMAYCLNVAGYLTMISIALASSGSSGWSRSCADSDPWGRRSCCAR